MVLVMLCAANRTRAQTEPGQTRTTQKNAEVRWWDGTTAAAPRGKLLSDNLGWWGPSVLTGVTYDYKNKPTSPPDVQRRDKSRFGRRLLNGHPAGHGPVGVAIKSQPLIVTFDFQRPCTFQEIDVISPNERISVQLQTRADKSSDWEAVFDQPREDKAHKKMRRLKLDSPAGGRYLRLRIKAGDSGKTSLNEVLAWGDAQVSEKTPQTYNPLGPRPEPTSNIAGRSIAGIKSTSFSDATYWQWQRNIQSAASGKGPVWSRLATWGPVTNKPILPQKQDLVQKLSFTMARDGGQHRALALTNRQWKEARNTRVSLSDFHRVGGDESSKADPSAKPSTNVRGVLRVGGAMPSRNYGVTISPLFEAGNMLPPALMHKYLTNADAIAQFPKLTLRPAGSAVLWLSVRTQGAEPGVYQATLEAAGSPPIPIRVHVLDVSPPRPRAWVETYSKVTHQFPFEELDRLQHEVAFRKQLGITVWHTLPRPGTAAALARKTGRAIFKTGVLPHKYRGRGYHGKLKPDRFTDKDMHKIRREVEKTVAQTKRLGLNYDDWYTKLWDELHEKDAKQYGQMARIVHKIDPKIRISCNPSFWIGAKHGVADDQVVYKLLHGWYNEQIAISNPMKLLLHNHPKCMTLFDHPRDVNAFYKVASHHAKSERPQNVLFYRREPWDAFKRGWNGWGFYAYYQPRGNPWNDRDARLSRGGPRADYQVVYPGPHGPIPTRPAEAMARGWDDYRLLTLLKQQGRKQVLKKLLDQYQSGASLDHLRSEALKAAAAPPH